MCYTFWLFVQLFGTAPHHFSRAHFCTPSTANAFCWIFIFGVIVLFAQEIALMYRNIIVAQSPTHTQTESERLSSHNYRHLQRIALQANYCHDKRSGCWQPSSSFEISVFKWCHLGSDNQPAIICIQSEEVRFFCLEYVSLSFGSCQHTLRFCYCSMKRQMIVIMQVIRSSGIVWRVCPDAWKVFPTT